MNRRIFPLLLAALFVLILGACSNQGKEASVDAPESKVSPKEMAERMLKQFEQPALVELTAEEVRQIYHLDPSLLEDYSIRIPLMNVKTNEVAILKVKDAKDAAAVEAAVKQRAADVQKQFETYLPDQYENAKNYKLVAKGKYLLFVISENADEFVKAFDTFFTAK